MPGRPDQVGLCGRDISLGGMRVESHPDIAIGDELRIGLHVRGRDDLQQSIPSG